MVVGALGLKLHAEAAQANTYIKPMEEKGRP
jgi:hypothetical protein